MLQRQPVARRAAVAGEKDERRRVRGLGTEGEVQEDERVGIEMEEQDDVPTIQITTMIVWMTMNRQLPMKPVTSSATRTPRGASSIICWFTG